MGEQTAISWCDDSEVQWVDRAQRQLPRPLPQTCTRGPEMADDTPSARRAYNRTAPLIDYTTITEKACIHCGEVKPVSEFQRRADTRALNGWRYRSWCATCVRERDRLAEERRRRESGVPQRFGPLPNPPRDGDRMQARQRINVEVRTGRRPRPNTLPCTDCGHVWSAGERRHEYDHYLGYAAEHHDDVEPVCTICHSRRAWAKGEMRRHGAGPDGRLRISVLRRSERRTRDEAGRFAEQKETSNG